VLWIAFISIVFCLPEVNPVNSQTLNYAPVAVGIVLAYALGSWAISARWWFVGPINQIAGAPPSSTPCVLIVWILTISGRFAQMNLKSWAPVLRSG
jgi:hypothetical protein